MGVAPGSSSQMAVPLAIVATPAGSVDVSATPPQKFSLVLSTAWTQDELSVMTRLAGAGFSTAALTRLDAGISASRELFATLGTGLHVAFSLFSSADPGQVAARCRLHVELLHAALALEAAQASHSDSAALATEVDELRRQLCILADERDKAMGQLRALMGDTTRATTYDAARIKTLGEAAKTAEHNLQETREVIAAEKLSLSTDRDSILKEAKHWRQEVIRLSWRVVALEATPPPIDPKHLAEDVGHLAKLVGNSDDLVDLLKLTLAHRRHTNLATFSL